MIEVLDREPIQGIDNRVVFLGKVQKTNQYRTWIEDSTGWMKNKGSAFFNEAEARIDYRELIEYVQKWG